MKRCGSRTRQLTELTEEERRRLVQTCVEQVTDAYTSTVFQSSARNRYLITRISRMTDRTMWALQSSWSVGTLCRRALRCPFLP